MIVSDILSRVKRQFGDESGVQVTDTDIIRWVNDGQRQIALANEGLLEKTAKADSVANTQEYSFPVDMLLFRGLSYLNPGTATYYKLKGLSLNELNEVIDGWDGTQNTGTPQYYTVFAGKFQVFPIPDTGYVNGFKVFYTRIPTDVSVGADTPDLPLLYHESLVKYCLQQAFELDADFEASQFKEQQLHTDIAALRGRDDWKTNETYPTITVSYEDL